jgi:hypothetical protein
MPALYLERTVDLLRAVITLKASHNVNAVQIEESI